MDRRRRKEVRELVRSSRRPLENGGPIVLRRGLSLILEVDGVPMNGMDDLQRVMDGTAVDRTMPILVHRGGRLATFEVRPVELPS